MMCDRACTPPRAQSPSGGGRHASRLSSRGRGPGINIFAEVDTNTMPNRKVSRVERRLGLDDDEEEDDAGSGSFSTPRGSWPLNTQAPPRASGDSAQERPSDNSLGRLTAQDYAAHAYSEPIGVDGGNRRGSVGPVMASGSGVSMTPQSWQTPEVNRIGTTRMTGGNFGLPIVPSLLYTPQIAPGLLARRLALDTELDSINAEHRIHPLPPVTPLIPGKLYIGGFPDEETLPILRSEGIRHIINCASDDYMTHPAVAAEFDVVDLPASDSMDYLILHHDYEPFATLVDNITEQLHEKVFVHCIAGINRSVTLCIAYLMDRLGYSPIEAVRLFRTNGRMRILENVGFRHQLVDHYLQSSAAQTNEEGEEESHREEGFMATQRPSTSSNGYRPSGKDMDRFMAPPF